MESDSHGYSSISHSLDNKHVWIPQKGRLGYGDFDGGAFERLRPSYLTWTAMNFQRRLHLRLLLSWVLDLESEYMYLIALHGLLGDTGFEPPFGIVWQLLYISWKLKNIQLIEVRPPYRDRLHFGGGQTDFWGPWVPPPTLDWHPRTAEDITSFWTRVFGSPKPGNFFAGDSSWVSPFRVWLGGFSSPPVLTTCWTWCLPSPATWATWVRAWLKILGGLSGTTVPQKLGLVWEHKSYSVMDLHIKHGSGVCRHRLG